MDSVENIKLNNWYVYRHIREDKNIPFYIGIGCLKNYGRAKQKDKDKRNSYWNRIVGKTKWKVEIILDGLTKEEASEKEKEFIKLYGRVDNSTGILCNMTDGGDGTFGVVFTEDRRIKLRESKIGNLNPSFGVKQSQETRNKKSIEFKKAWLNYSTEERENRIKKSRQGVLKVQGKAVIVYSYLTGELIGEYDSISYACRCLGLEGRDGKASMVCRGLRNRVGNYTFKYKSDVIK